MENSSSNLTVVKMVARSPVLGSDGAMETSWQESPSISEMVARGALKELSLVDVRVWMAQLSPWIGVGNELMEELVEVPVYANTCH